jgi:conjugal transfer ATP-binding protein TraC
MNQNEHTSMMQLLSVQITGDVEVKSIEKTISETKIPPVSQDIQLPESNKQVLQSKAALLVETKTEKDSSEDKEDLVQGERIYHEALAYIKDAISPAMMKITPHDLQINDTFCKTLFTYAYPDFLDGNWLSPLINWDAKFDVSMFIYPTDSQKIQKYLRRRLTELQSEKYLNQERGLTSDPYIDAQLQDVEELRSLLIRGSEKYFHFSIYVTLYADDRDKLLKISNDIQNMLHGRNILTKPALLRAEQGYTATGPFCRDEVSVYRNISTRGLSTAFPFTSATLSQDDGVLYGINTHNNSLIIYDRFRTENANMVVLAKS